MAATLLITGASGLAEEADDEMDQEGIEDVALVRAKALDEKLT